MEKIIIDDAEIYYKSCRTDKNKATLVFIHGSGGDHHKWDKQMANLPIGFNGVAIDLPGHGLSPKPFCQSIKEMAFLLAKFIKELSFPAPFILIGHSMGSAIAMQTCLDFPDLINSMVLIGAGSRLRVMPHLLESLRQNKMDPGFVRLGFSSTAPVNLVENEISSVLQLDPSILLNDFSSCDNFDISNDLEKIVLPVLIIVGNEDKLTPVKYARLLNQQISSSKLVIVPQAAHYVMLEKAAEVNNLIKEFLSELS